MGSCGCRWGSRIRTISSRIYVKRLFLLSGRGPARRRQHLGAALGVHQRAEALVDEELDGGDLRRVDGPPIFEALLEDGPGAVGLFLIDKNTRGVEGVGE